MVFACNRGNAGWRLGRSFSLRGWFGIGADMLWGRGESASLEGFKSRLDKRLVGLVRTGVVLP